MFMSFILLSLVVVAEQSQNLYVQVYATRIIPVIVLNILQTGVTSIT